MNNTVRQLKRKYVNLSRRASLKVETLRNNLGVLVAEGKEMPITGTQHSVQAEHLTDAGSLHAQAERQLESILEKIHPRIIIQGATARVSLDGFGPVVTTISHDNPFHETEGMYVTWTRDPRLYRKALEDSRYAHSKEEKKTNIIFWLEKIVSDNFRAVVPYERAKEIAKNRGMTVSQVMAVREDTANEFEDKKTKDKISPPVNWEDVASKTLFVEVSYVSTGKLKGILFKDTEWEYGIQVYDALSGKEMVDGYDFKPASKILEEAGIALSSNKVENLANALKIIKQNNSGKILPVVMREDDQSGRNVSELSKLIGTESYPVVESHEVMNNTNISIKHNPRTGRKVAAASLAALALAYGSWSIGNRGARYGKKAYEALPPNVSSSPVVMITSADYDHVVRKLEVKLDATDPDKINKVDIFVDGRIFGSYAVSPETRVVETKYAPGKLKKGNHRVVVKATDLTGVEGTSAPYQVKAR